MAIAVPDLVLELDHLAVAQGRGPVQPPSDRGHILGVDQLLKDAWARRGELLAELYAGEAAPGLPASPTILWPIASISKTFSAAAVMRLVELGALTVNPPVHRLLPAFRGDGREEIRLRHLLTHTSGLPYESPEMVARLAARTPLAALTDEAFTAPLRFRPGTRFSYSDYAFLIAARMAETATGDPFPELVRRLVLEPMGLRDTFLLPDAAAQARIARVRDVQAEGTAGEMYNSAYARSLAHPAFSVVSSAPDMLRFLRHFVPGGPRIHAEATVRAMTSVQTGEVPGDFILLGGLGAEARIPWSYVFELQTPQAPAILSELASFSAFGHPGASGCHLLADPVADLEIVILTNAHLHAGLEDWFRVQQQLLAAAFLEGERHDRAADPEGRDPGGGRAVPGG